MNKHMSEVLFVGGPLDSQIRVLDERHSQYVHEEIMDRAPEKPPPPFGAAGADLPNNAVLDMEEHVYVIDELAGDVCKWRVARSKDVCRDEMIQKLVDWYCGGEIKPKCNLRKGEL
jgi:hypothetical protein